MNEKNSNYTMPAEWEPHEAVWLAWPYDEITFPDRVEKAEDTFVEMIRALEGSERVELLVLDDEMKERAREKLADACAGLALKGDLGEPVLGDADGPACGTHFRAQVLHLSNRHAVVAGNHHNARAFEDLAEFLDHFLFLGSIHGFTPSMGVSPRLSSGPRGGRSGP